VKDERTVMENCIKVKWRVEKVDGELYKSERVREWRRTMENGIKVRGRVVKDEENSINMRGS
jgi:hypothetical protein